MANLPPTQPVVILIPDGSGGEDALSIDVCTSENHALSNTITDHPVEEGAPISDHSRPEARRLQLDCIVSNTPLTQTPGTDFANFAWAQLVDLHERPRLITVSTSRGLYESMGVESVSNPVDVKSANALRFTLSLKMVRVVRNRLTRIVVSRDTRAQKKVKKGGVMVFTVEETDASSRNVSNALRVLRQPVL